VIIRPGPYGFRSLKIVAGSAPSRDFESNHTVAQILVGMLERHQNPLRNWSKLLPFSIRSSMDDCLSGGAVCLVIQKCDSIDSTPLLFLDGQRPAIYPISPALAHYPAETPYSTRTVVKQWSNSSSDS
jgi:hypothetical protein